MYAAVQEAFTKKSPQTTKFATTWDALTKKIPGKDGAPHGGAALLRRTSVLTGGQNLGGGGIHFRRAFVSSGYFAVPGAAKPKRKTRYSACLSFWQREKDSNPHIQSQSLLCYPYTIPLFDCRARKRRCYYSKTRGNVNRKIEKNKKFCGPGKPGPRERVNGGWDHRSYPGAAPAFCSGAACSPEEQDSGYGTSSDRCTGSASSSPRFHRS